MRLPWYGNTQMGCFPRCDLMIVNTTPVTGKVFCEVARSSAADVELALDAAHNAKAAWGRTSTTERANILNKIADRIEANLPMLAAAET